jgi:hypothetical protein
MIIRCRGAKDVLVAPPRGLWLVGALSRSGMLVGTSLQKRLQNKDRGHLVDDGFAAHSGMTRLVKVPVGLGRGQPLVPKMDGDGKLRTEFFGEGLRLGRLRALITRHMERVAHDGLGNAMFTQNPSHRFQVSPPVRAVQGEERLRRITQGIGDGEADTAVTDIEP